VRLAGDKIRSLARARGLTLSEALRRAEVSRNAFYHLTRRPTVVPRSVLALAEVLGVRSSDLLDETPPSPDDRAAALLREARRIHARSPQSSFENIWHTLWLLEVSPAERLHRSLIRGHAASPHR
jgi:transcriptional regulator with XRE-family HTH domain